MGNAADHRQRDINIPTVLARRMGHDDKRRIIPYASVDEY